MIPGNNIQQPSNPEVSVIIPTYNRAGMILNSIRSVLVQNFVSYEIVVVDDGSTDSTREIIFSMSAQYQQIRYFHQENGGPSTARNRGLSEARGRYIAFLDSDDLFEPEKLVKQVDYLRRNEEVGLVHTGFTKFNNAGERMGYRDPSWFHGWVYPRILLYWMTLIPPSTVMIRREIFERVGRFDENLRIVEDLDLWRRIARVYPFGVIKESLSLIRVHPENFSGDTLTASMAFEKYLLKAFKEDATLSKSFQRRALSRMYGNAAYSSLGGKRSTSSKAARSDARRAIQFDPINVHGYIGLGASLLPFAFRVGIAAGWRSIRTYFMQRNRES